MNQVTQNNSYNEEKMVALVQQNKDFYQNRNLFPCISFDDFLNRDTSTETETTMAFPFKAPFDFYKQNDPVKKKLTMDQVKKGHLASNVVSPYTN